MTNPLGRLELFPILIQNQKDYGNPIGISRQRLQDWATDVTLSNSSGTFLYTGSLYQMMPKADKFVELMSRAETSSGFAIALRFLGGKAASSLSQRFVSEDVEKAERSRKILRNASKLLKNSGIEHGYLGKDEPYSGILFYELGLEETFSEVAAEASRLFRQKGVKRLITLDPHSTFALKQLFPRFVEGFDVEVMHYMEVAKNAKNQKFKDELVIHDPCLLSRRLSLSELYRSYLDSACIKYVEPTRSGRKTFCCGGPIESIAPSVSRSISCLRCTQLAEKGDKAVVACPICLSNLGKCNYLFKGNSSTHLQVVDALELI